MPLEPSNVGAKRWTHLLSCEMWNQSKQIEATTGGLTCSKNQIALSREKGLTSIPWVSFCPVLMRDESPRTVYGRARMVIKRAAWKSLSTLLWDWDGLLV